MSDDDDSNNGRQARRKAKVEAHLTAGCGFGKAKKRFVDAFWHVMWPGLKNCGWTSVDGEGLRVGYTTFLAPGVKLNPKKKRTKGVFDRIRDVVDFVLTDTQRVERESKVGEKFLAEIDRLERTEARGADEEAATSRRRSSALVDLSWKEGSVVYPKQASRIGDRYQPCFIPPAGSYKTREATSEESRKEHPMNLADQIWDSKRGETSGAFQWLHGQVPAEKKDSYLRHIHEAGYEKVAVERLEQDEEKERWTDAEKATFHRELFRYRKDINAVAKLMNKSVNCCFAYYLNSFKKSDDYRLLKVVCEEERLEKRTASDQGYDACAVCGDGGNLLICDGCEGEYHMTCVSPPLKNIPEGDWECDECVNIKFLELRDNLMRQSRLYTSVTGDKGQPPAKKRKLENGSSANGANSNVRLRPSSPVLNLVCQMAASLSEAMSSSSAATVASNGAKKAANVGGDWQPSSSSSLNGATPESEKKAGDSTDKLFPSSSDIPSNGEGNVPAETHVKQAPGSPPVDRMETQDSDNTPNSEKKEVEDRDEIPQPSNNERKEVPPDGHGV